MKKIIVLFFASIMVAGLCANACDIDMDYKDGIYHFVLSGEKIKKHIATSLKIW